MIMASLPMYDWPEIRAATDALWNGLSRHSGFEGNLQRGKYDDLWRNPRMEFSQTCGYPFTHEFKGMMNYIATPHYQAEGCSKADYCSVVFAREPTPLQDFKGKVPAVNSVESMSGMLALKLVFAPVAKIDDFFAAAVLTGSHLASLAEVREGRADVCAIDAVCVALAKRYRPLALEGLVEIAKSPPVPALPFVTRNGDINRWREALHKTFADPALAAVREALLLKAFSILPEGSYDVILDREKQAGNLNLKFLEG